MNWAPGAHRRARAARGVPAPVRGGGPHGRAPLGDERLPRDRRRARGRRPATCSPRSCASSGGSTAAWSPTTSRSASSPTTTTSPPTPRRPRRWRSRPASTSSCPAPTATARRCCDAVRSGRVSDVDRRHRRRRVLRAKFELGLFERPFVDPTTSRRSPTPPAHRAPRPDDRPQVARAAAQRRRPAAARRPRLARRDRAQRRRRPPPVRRLHVPGPRRVAAGGAAERAERVRHAARPTPPRRRRRRRRPHGARRAAGPPRDRVRFAAGCDVSGTSTRRVRRRRRRSPPAPTWPCW